MAFSILVMCSAGTFQYQYQILLICSIKDIAQCVDGFLTECTLFPEALMHTDLKDSKKQSVLQ